jgi:hypothetical protein
MKTNRKYISKETKPLADDFIERLWEESWTYIKTVVDVMREPILILDKNFKVMAANEPFYNTFQVEQKDTENKIVYDLGNGQWNIPALRKLLEDILPKNTFFKGFEVTHEFPVIGKKVIILNGRQIHKIGGRGGNLPPIILLAMEDVTDMMNVAELLAMHTNKFESEIEKRTDTLEIFVEMLRKEVTKLSKQNVKEK